MVRLWLSHHGHAAKRLDGVCLLPRHVLSEHLLLFYCFIYLFFPGEDDPQVAEVLFNLSAVVGAQSGRLEETQVLLRRCLEAQKRLHGPGRVPLGLGR